MLPSRPGERLGSFQKNDNSFRDLGYEAKIEIKDYINHYVDKSKK